MDMSTIDKIDKRRPSALEILDRVKPEDPVERVQRLKARSGHPRRKVLGPPRKTFHENKEKEGQPAGCGNLQTADSQCDKRCSGTEAKNSTQALEGF